MLFLGKIPGSHQRCYCRKAQHLGSCEGLCQRAGWERALPAGPRCCSSSCTGGLEGWEGAALCRGVTGAGSGSRGLSLSFVRSLERKPAGLGHPVSALLYPNTKAYEIDPIPYRALLFRGWALGAQEIMSYCKEQQGSLLKWKRTILSNYTGSCHGNPQAALGCSCSLGTMEQGWIGMDQHPSGWVSILLRAEAAPSLVLVSWGAAAGSRGPGAGCRIQRQEVLGAPFAAWCSYNPCSNPFVFSAFNEQLHEVNWLLLLIYHQHYPEEEPRFYSEFERRFILCQITLRLKATSCSCL